MQYVRNISDSVSTAWNSINPATLSGAIDVIVVEHEDGSLNCSPFHVRFGKFSLLRPYEKKVEFRVNGSKQEHSMKLGEGGEAFFVFETTENIPESLQTSPLVSPASSPSFGPEESTSQLQDPDQFDLDADSKRQFQQHVDANGKHSSPRYLCQTLTRANRLPDARRILPQLLQPETCLGRLVRHPGTATQRRRAPSFSTRCRTRRKRTARSPLREVLEPSSSEHPRGS